LDALLVKSKHHAKRVDPDIDGFPQAQSPATSQWFSSKSSKKVMFVLFIFLSFCVLNNRYLHEP
jgi:hypothetical protein